MKFIKEKFDLEVLPSCRDIPMGLSHEKKEEIMKLCKMIPLKYLNFWKDLPIECEKMKHVLNLASSVPCNEIWNLRF